jgi:hypothetical protein
MQPGKKMPYRLTWRRRMVAGRIIINFAPVLSADMADRTS